MIINKKNIILLISVLFLSNILISKDISLIETNCKEKGLQEGSNEYKSCVMDLYNKKMFLEDSNNKNKT